MFTRYPDEEATSFDDWYIGDSKKASFEFKKVALIETGNPASTKSKREIALTFVLDDSTFAEDVDIYSNSILSISF
jgi:hypothetical protein